MSYFSINLSNQQLDPSWAALERDPLEKIIRCVSSEDPNDLSLLQGMRSVCRSWRAACTDTVQQLEVSNVHKDIAKFVPGVRVLRINLNIKGGSFIHGSDVSICSLSNLRELYINGLSIKQIEYLTSLAQKMELVKFEINIGNGRDVDLQNEIVNSLEALRHLPTITQLRLHTLENIDTLDALSALTRLSSLIAVTGNDSAMNQHLPLLRNLPLKNLRCTLDSFTPQNAEHLFALTGL